MSLNIRHLAVIVAAAFVAAPIVGAGAGYDAGTGVDAPNSEASALSLSTDVPYEAYLARHDDDWFRFAPATGALCFEISAADGPARDVVGDVVARHVANSGAVTLSSRFDPANSVNWALARPSTSEVRLGVSEPGLPGNHGDYAFRLDAHEIGDFSLDAGTGIDAPGTLDGALSVAGTGCFGGRLDAGIGDTDDAFVFNGVAGGQAIVSYAQTMVVDGVLKVVSPDGTVVARLASGDVVALDLPTTGDYYLVASSAYLKGFSYMTGLTVEGPPEPSPCRPTCIALE